MREWMGHGAFVVSHPCRKNKNATRMGHGAYSPLLSSKKKPKFVALLSSN
jgi:ribosomal protein L16/L10AE